jgi:hypothetical protein
MLKNETVVYNVLCFSLFINPSNKSARVLASMIYSSGSVCFPWVNVIAYIQVLLHFYYSRNKLHFYFWGPGENQKSLLLISLRRYSGYTGDSIHYHPAQLIVGTDEESKLWRSHYDRICRLRHISCGSG